MLEIYPDYYRKFTCLGGGCPDTCCAQWEVVVDDDTAALYAAVPGELGDALRRTLTTDEDGDRILRFSEGRCPLLTSGGLCSVQMVLGHKALCKTCREFPRLIQDYTNFREHSLSLSCPEAARLILLSPRVPALEASGTEGTEDVDYDSQDLALLRSTRETLFGILVAPALSVSEKLRHCLEAAGLAQETLDGISGPPTEPDPAAWDPAAFRQLFRGMDILSPHWSAALGRTSALTGPDPFMLWPQVFVNFCHDSFYRNLLCAVADFDLLPRIQAAAAACLLLRDLAWGGSREQLVDLMLLYDREVEHCADNRDALLDACCVEDFLSPAALLGQLS